MTLRSLLFALIATSAVAAPASPPGWKDPAHILKMLDARIDQVGDHRSVLLLEEARGSERVVREALVYGRKKDGQLVVLITQPKTFAGTGYLRVDRNLWFYDAKSGKWDRRTDRERIAGTNVRASDLSKEGYSAGFDAVFVGEELLGKVATRRLKLTAKPGHDVEFPTSEIWIDANYNLLKSTDYALSGKLMRTLLIPRYVTVVNQVTKEKVPYPTEVRIFDEIEKDRRMVMVHKSVELAPVAPNVFTKAWLESKSR